MPKTYFWISPETVDSRTLPLDTAQTGPFRQAMPDIRQIGL
jgi:hypothetical protein